jgi:5-methylcytosine-specific restriction enzyme subunit McrC
MNNLYSTEFEYIGEIKENSVIKEILTNIWENYKYYYPESDYYLNESEDSDKTQPYFSINGQLIKAKNYVGHFQINDLTISVFPKIMDEIINDYDKINEIFNEHFFFWLKTCSKIKFPFNDKSANLDNNNEFIEIIFYYMVNTICQIINSLPYYNYKIQQEDLKYPKGKILFNSYLNNYSLGKGNIIPCEYEPFSFDNQINQLIKYCCKLIRNLTNNREINIVIDQIIEELHEVSDIEFTLQQLEIIKVSVYYSVYEEIIHLCKLILLNTVPKYLNNIEKSITFLFPMEKIFEDYISSLIKIKFNDEYQVKSQKSDKYLQDDPEVFKIALDIYIHRRRDNTSIIIDTKYKYLDKEKNKKYGILQSDIYQMISYAYKTGIDKVLLIYPNTNEQYGEVTKFVINRHDNNESIKIKIIQVPFWSVHGTKDLEEKICATIKNGLESWF